MTNAQRILLTGATGFVGSAVLRVLSKQSDYDVRIAVRSDMADVIAQAYSVCKVGNFSSVTGWVEALSGVACVIHMAGRAHVMKQEADALSLFRKVNTEATLHLARQAIQCGVKRFIFVSSIGVNGAYTIGAPFDELSPVTPYAEYAISKYEAECELQELCRASAMELVIIRPPLVYAANAPGNFRRLLKLAATGLPMPFGCVENSRSLVALENLVDFIVCCIGHPRAANELFLISDGVDLSTPDIVRYIGIGMGRRIKMFPVPVPVIRFMANSVGKKNIFTQLCLSLSINATKARELLGWTPHITSQQALINAGRTYIEIRKKINE